MLKWTRLVHLTGFEVKDEEFIPLMFRLYGGRLNLENRMDACDETRKGQNVE